MRPTFILMQDGVIDTAGTPSGLMFNLLDLNQGFKVAIGCVNEFGEKEIVSLVADVSAVEGCGDWIVSSEKDGHNKRVDGWGFIESYVRVRLATLHREGRFDDLANLPIPITVRSGGAACIT